MKFYEDDRIQSLHDVFPTISGQINISYVRSTDNVVAWHRHHKQTDQWCCLKGSFKVGLYYPTYNRIEWVYLSDKEFKTITITPGIWHGYKALEPNSILLYYLTEKYDPQDEQKVIPGFFGEDWNTQWK